MAVINPEVLKSKFEQGDIPDAQAYIDLIDTLLSLSAATDQLPAAKISDLSAAVAGNQAIVNNAAAISATNTALVAVDEKILYLGLFANTTDLPAGPHAPGTHADVGTEIENIRYKWDHVNSVWYKGGASLYYSSLANLQGDADNPPVVGAYGLVGPQYDRYGVRVAGTWVKLDSADVDNEGADVKTSNKFGSRFGSPSDFRANVAYNVAPGGIEGGYSYVYVNAPSEPAVEDDDDNPLRKAGWSDDFQADTNMLMFVVRLGGEDIYYFKLY